MASMDMAGALRTRGCPVCNHLHRVAFDFFCRFQLDLSTREQTQRSFAECGGFCPRHTWQLAAIMAPQDLSNGLRRLVQRASAEIGGRATEGEAADCLAAWFLSREPCRVCGLEDEAAADFTARLAEFVGNEVGRTAYLRSQGACLPHLHRLLAAVSTDALRQFLLEHSARRLNELADDMQAYASKHESLRRALATENERDAYRRALIHLVGDKRVGLP